MDQSSSTASIYSLLHTICSIHLQTGHPRTGAAAPHQQRNHSLPKKVLLPDHVAGFLNRKYYRGQIASRESRPGSCQVYYSTAKLWGLGYKFTLTIACRKFVVGINGWPGRPTGSAVMNAMQYPQIPGCLGGRGEAADNLLVLEVSTVTHAVHECAYRATTGSEMEPPEHNVATHPTKHPSSETHISASPSPRYSPPTPPCRRDEFYSRNPYTFCPC